MNTKTVYWIEGDGIGAEIWQTARPLIDGAVSAAYGDAQRIEWHELLAGDKAVAELNTPLPEATLDALKTATLAIKGPLGTPVGTGIRSLNVALRQILDLYACIRPIKHYAGLETPVKYPEKVNMIVFRENTEDVYAGIEFAAGSPEAKKLAEFLHDAFGVDIFPQSALGIKPMSAERSKRLVRAALKHAIDYGQESLTLVHKGNIMKFTEGAFRQWGYDMAFEEFADKVCTEKEPVAGRVIVKDRIADAMFQDVLQYPESFQVIATPNLNGDYLSDALAAQVGGLGMAPGVNMSDSLGFFEATHGTAPSLVGKDMANPCSLLLSAAMMLDHMNWAEAATRLRNAVEQTITAKTVTADLAQQIHGSKTVSCSAFGDLVAAKL